jgi:hypothetical protein
MVASGATSTSTGCSGGIWLCGMSSARMPTPLAPLMSS